MLRISIHSMSPDAKSLTRTTRGDDTLVGPSQHPQHTGASGGRCGWPKHEPNATTRTSTSTAHLSHDWKVNVHVEGWRVFGHHGNRRRSHHGDQEWRVAPKNGPEKDCERKVGTKQPGDDRGGFMAQDNEAVIKMIIKKAGVQQ